MSSNSNVVVSEPVSFKYFKLIDFEKVCLQHNFKLPPEILTSEILAKRSTKAGIKAKAVRTSSRVPKPKKTDEINIEEGSRRCKKTINSDEQINIDRIESSSIVAQHRSVKRTYTDNADSAATLAWKAPNFPRKKKKTIHLNEQQIRALPEQPNIFANYNGRAFIENPFMRQSTPSVLIQGAYKLNAEQIEKSFIRTCFRRQTESQSK
ncbi:hypothetical protein C1645_776820 [Glomus cerebriforme]|uniref:Uncharacterized protein n=1 Tax=Glomus cerebriforme TaxID=658196 RepID=A0A397SUP8_9GLOM|nr:hypothetical protein C1645_776820 [Glomus cerebriforme]